MRMRVLSWVGGALLAAGFGPASPSAAQDRDAFLQQQRRLDDQIRADRNLDRSPADRVFLDYGGWYSFHLFLFDDGIEPSRTFRRHDLRVWTRFQLDEGAHELYLRGRLSFLDFNAGDSYDGDDDDVEGMNLERGTYRFDLARAAGVYGWTAAEANVIVFAGRDLVEIGTGLTLSTPLDHVDIRLETAEWRLRGLVGRTVGSTQDIDLTRPADRTRRAFFGAELSYTAPQRHEPFVYVLWQRDHNGETYPTPLQEFDYDSFYVGAGSTGELSPRLMYRAEWAYESGRSFGDRAFMRSDVIRAWGANAQLEYQFPGDYRVRATLEYLFGSGDADRQLSPTDAIGGNVRGNEDTGFNAWGYRDTGLSFAPRYSNVHLWRAGAAWYPWPRDPRLDGVEVGLDALLYHKHHRSGAVSDPTAARTSGYLGSEVDAYVNWAITRDVSWTARVGVFFPGDAFDGRTARPFFLTGVTWSF